MKLDELYSNAELMNEREALSHSIYMEILDFDFTVQTLPWTEIESLQSWGCGSSLTASMREHGTPNQIEIINSKARAFDATRCVVLEAGRVIDGHHHLMAAVQCQRDVTYIDLDEALTEPDDTPTP